jgi:hypothetical protein
MLDAVLGGARWTYGRARTPCFAPSVAREPAESGQAIWRPLVASRAAFTLPLANPCENNGLFGGLRAGGGIRVHEFCCIDPGRVKTLRGITAPGILRLVVTLRAKKCKNSSSAQRYNQIRFRFHTAWTHRRRDGLQSSFHVSGRRIEPRQAIVATGSLVTVS